MNGCFSPSTDYHQEGNKFHGCAWKIVYPDFVTAMMEYFLLLWFFQLGHPRIACKVSQIILLRLQCQYRPAVAAMFWMVKSSLKKELHKARRHNMSIRLFDLPLKRALAAVMGKKRMIKKQ